MMRSATLMVSLTFISLSTSALANDSCEDSSAEGNASREQLETATSSDEQGQFLATLIKRSLPEEDRQFGSSVFSALSEKDPEVGIRKMNAARAQLSGPSFVDALLQVRTAKHHVTLGRNDIASSLYQEAIQDYPDLPGPRQSAINSLAYTDQAVTAARMWMDFAASQPIAAKQIDGYTFGALASNLLAVRQVDTRNALFIALDRIDYDPGSNIRRNQLFMGLFENAAADRNRFEEAKIILSKIENIAFLRSILSDRRYRRFWGEIPNNPTNWRIRASRWLDALAIDSASENDGVVANTFFTAVRQYSGPTKLLSAYEPALSGVYDNELAPGPVHNYVFWPSPLAEAFQLDARYDDADQLFRRSQSFFNGMDGLNGTNIAANYARMLNLQGRHDEALAQIEPAIAR